MSRRWRPVAVDYETSQAIAEEFRNGATTVELAARYSLSAYAVTKVLRDHGIDWATAPGRVPHRSKLPAINAIAAGHIMADQGARILVERAIRAGILRRPDKCEECGAKAVDKNDHHKIMAHHDDYSYPLSVRWLCPKCHGEWHRNNVAAGAVLVDAGRLLQAVGWSIPIAEDN